MRIMMKSNTKPSTKNERGRPPHRSEEQEKALIEAIESLISEGYKVSSACEKHGILRNSYWRIKQKHGK